MRTAWLYSFALVLCIFFVRPVSASVVINEVFFDPLGSDTGLEKIELYNNSGASVSLGGWQLYPDGIGYFSFPAGFSLAPYSFVTAYLRIAGTDDAQNLYHISPAANMGNSSGSVALFTGEPRGKETIIDFVRYHKPGSSEKKTWESAADAAGLWSAGQFVDIGGFQEGRSIALATDGMREGASSWIVVSSPTIGGFNAESRDAVSGISQISQESESENAAVMSSMSPQLEVSVPMLSSSDSASTVSSSSEATVTLSMPLSPPPSESEIVSIAPIAPQPAIPPLPFTSSSTAIVLSTPAPPSFAPFLSSAPRREKLAPIAEDHALPENAEAEINGIEPEVFISQNNRTIAVSGFFSPTVLFFAASIVLGVLSAAGYLFFRLR